MFIIRAKDPHGIGDTRFIGPFRTVEKAEEFVNVLLTTDGYHYCEFYIETVTSSKDV